jgi:c-di-GMP phosphodiesterase
MDIFVARQPVFTRKKKVFGYELLFRLDLENIFPEINGDTATANVLTNTFFTFELNEILAGKPGLVNFTRNLILQNTPLLFPKEYIIIEVLENIVPEPEVLESLRVFKCKGL